MMACIDGHMDIVEALLDSKADTSLLDKNGNTAEELASINNNVSYVFINKIHLLY